MKVIVPENYKTPLNIRETEVAIKKLKDRFEDELSEKLNITRVSAPLFVIRNTGLNDNLSGHEHPVSFTAPNITDLSVEIVHSLAKWKRMALYRYDFQNGEGLYTDMNAIRREEETSNLHSIYVDQWDWERVIAKEDRTEDFLEVIVKKLFDVFKSVEAFTLGEYPELGEKWLPEKITFITTQELEDKYPGLNAKEREDAAAKEYGAIFLKKIGGVLKSGEKHDGRAPDYDDWNLNGDIIFWNPLLNCAIELSSMGIRVDSESLERQLHISNALDRLEMQYHQMVKENILPLTIGGGIGQSRICMYFLRKAHVGEVQASIWSEDTEKVCKENGINLL